MWNSIYANRFCHEKDKFADHKWFCERIVKSKPKCNTSAPQEFKFLKSRSKKELMAKEKQWENEHNNNLLMQKLIEMERKPQKYHPKSQKFHPHPRSLRFSRTSSLHHEYDTANAYLLKRITLAKPAYSREKQLKDHRHKIYIETQLQKNSQYYNPYLKYATPKCFEMNLYKSLHNHGFKTEFGAYLNRSQMKPNRITIDANSMNQYSYDNQYKPINTISSKKKKYDFTKATLSTEIEQSYS